MKKKSRTEAERAADVKRTGRPPLAKKNKRSRALYVQATRAEEKTIQAEADRLGISISRLLLKPWRKKKVRK